MIGPELNLETDNKLISFLFKAFVFLLHLSIAMEVIMANFKIGYILRFLFFLFFARMYARTVKNRYYTFWSLSTFLLVYIGYKIYQNITIYQHTPLYYIYGAMILMLVWMMYLLFSPIFYPRVSWWEYDFRYRDDLNIKIQKGEEWFEGRLTDLRRFAGCVASFEDLKRGDEIIVQSDIQGKNVMLRGQVMSKRRETVGRPIIYGVKFRFESKTAKRRYKELGNIWKAEKIKKNQLKFSQVN